MRKNQLTICLLLFMISLSAQSDLKLGQWKSHLPYQQARSITQSESTVYFASPWSLFMIEKDENSVQFMSKVEGLSDVGMGVIKYVPARETLIASYKNSNIDLLKPTRIVNLPFIKEDPNIIGDKSIYNIHLEGEDLAYLACGFGVVELNVEREEFGFTVKMNLKVNDVIVYEGDFYAATDEGIYRAPNDGSLNLQDFGNWTLLGAEEGFPDDYSARALELYNDGLYLDIDNVLYSYSNGALTEVHNEANHEMVFLTAEGSHLIMGVNCAVSDSCSGGRVLFFDQSLSLQYSGNNCVNSAFYAIEDQTGQIWYSDRQDKVRIADMAGGDCIQQRYNSPYSHEAIEIVVDENDVYVTTTVPPANNTNGFYRLQENSWTNFNGLFNSAVSDIFMAYRAAVHPENKKVYIGTFAQGIWEMDGEDFIRYDNTNSSLQTSTAQTSQVQIGGLAFDQNNDLWVTNYRAPNPLAVLRNDGTWQNDFSLPFTALQDVIVDESGNKWCLVDGSGQGVLVFNEGDPNISSDDMVRTITTANSALPNNRVNCLVMDLDGDIWLGTDEGVIVFECGSNVFSPQCRGSLRIVDVGGFGGFLLQTESVQTIAVDGANRKWFGTTNGVFVQSPNGEELIAFFDKDNSPLFDNLISDIAINQISGEVYIGTGSGLISVRGEATEGGTRHANEVYAFPNPVQPDYTGPIAIKGLPRDADVKITDVRGQLVFETQALGGQAIWDGRDYTGRKAASGVYLVFSTSKQLLDNPDAQVTKILFMK